MSSELRLDEVLRRIDVYGRLAFGGQVVAAMGMLAAPAIFVVACILPFALWDDNRGEALFFWLGGWVLAVLTEAGGIALGVFCWRWSGDWITEWPGYAVGFAIAGAANALLAYLLTSTPSPVPASFAIAIGAAFAAGFVIAGNLAGTKVLADQREQRQREREIARRR
ncbi:MAG: hypothetical protein HY873_08000 [Chloroflexi bacterium]|nr:hypothetical protein [Chloroflexota bacterium]